MASIEDHTEAFLTALAATGQPVGDHVAKGDPPHCVTYLIPGGQTSGPLCDPDADVEFIWQVTSVGRTAAEARWMGDKVRTAIEGVTLTVDNRSLWPLRLVTSSPGVSRDDDVTPPLFYCVDRFTTVSTPGPSLGS